MLCSLKGMVIVPKAFPLEFRRDVVAVAVARKGDATLSQISLDFGISESCLHRWLKLADIDDGVRPGVASVESDEARELKRRVGEANVVHLPVACTFRLFEVSGSCSRPARPHVRSPRAWQKCQAPGGESCSPPHHALRSVNVGPAMVEAGVRACNTS